MRFEAFLMSFEVDLMGFEVILMKGLDEVTRTVSNLIRTAPSKVVGQIVICPSYFTSYKSYLRNKCNLVNGPPHRSYYLKCIGLLIKLIITQVGLI